MELKNLISFGLSKTRVTVRNLKSKKPKRLDPEAKLLFTMEGKMELEYSFRDDEYPET